MMTSTPAATTGPRRWIRPALIIIAAWTVNTGLTIPPAILVDQAATPPTAVGITIAHVMLGAVAWMAATPVILWIGRRLPLTGPRRVHHLAAQIAICLVLTPLIVLIGYALDYTVLRWLGAAHPSGHVVLRGVVINSLFQTTTYVAVAAIGQAMAYFERYRVRERMLARAQLDALRARIQPHFLFNTLNAIATLGYRDPALADTALTRLADLLRASLEDGAPESTLRDEIAFVGGYLELYRMLMPDRLDVRFDIDPAAWSAAVPSLLLQPLVENAIVHGIARRTDGGRIAIIGRVVDGQLVLLVRNDAPERPGSDGHGIGLANVRERLRVLYGDDQRVGYDASDPSSVAVTIELPMHAADGAHAG